MSKKRVLFSFALAIAVVMSSCFFLACKSKHTHNYASSWSISDTHHWRECSCGKKIDESVHTLVDNECTVCGHKISSGGGDIEGGEGSDNQPTPVTDFSFTLDENTNTYIVTGYSGTTANISIPSEYEGKAVTAIGDNAFNDCETITSVVLPEGIVTIGTKAFYSCNSLTSITMPNTLTTINEHAFYFCSVLNSITIPQNVVSIGKYAFCYCYGLTEIKYNATYHADFPEFNFVFYNAGIESAGIDVVIGANVSNLPAYLFEPYGNTGGYSPNLKRVSFNEGSVLESIGKYAFRGCENFSSITIPSSVQSIGERAFLGCKALEEINYNATNCADFNSGNQVFFNAGSNGNGITVKIGANVKKIPAKLFYSSSGELGVPKIVEVQFEANSECESIGAEAFRCLNYLVSITVPQLVTEIGDKAFEKCFKLIQVQNLSQLSITVGATDNGYVAYYAKNVYGASGQSKLSVDGDGYILYTDGNEKLLVGYKGTETNLTLPADVTAVNQYALYNSNKITSLTLGEKITSIGDYAFYKTTSLAEINYNVKNCADCNFSSNSIFYDAGKSGNGIILKIGDNVQHIPAYLFYPYQSNSQHAPKIISVIMGTGVTSIGTAAFSDCHYLTGVYIVDLKAWCSIDFASIASNPLYSAKNLYLNGQPVKKLVIPNSVSEIKKYAFAYCLNIYSVTVPQSVTSIGSSAFSGCDKIAEVYNSSSLNIVKGETGNGYIAYRAFDVYTSSSSASKITTDSNGYVIYTSGSEKTLIGYDGTDTELILPNSITKINQWALRYNNNVVSVTIGNSVTYIGYGAFTDCDSLTDVIIGDGVIEIGGSAFASCDSLANVTIGSGVKLIGSSAFGNSPALESVTFKNTSGWFAVTKLDDTTGEAVDFTDPATNAEIIGSTDIFKRN